MTSGTLALKQLGIPSGLCWVPGPRCRHGLHRASLLRNGADRHARKKGRSDGREISWTPTAFAGIHLLSYRLWWQLGVPFWVGPDKQFVEPSRPGAPLPGTVDRMLAEMAIVHMVRVNRPGLRQRPRVAKVIDWANRHRSLI